MYDAGIQTSALVRLAYRPRLGVITSNAGLATSPSYSIIIAVCDDWIPLNHCLRSIAQQTNGPRFDVTIVDDGSKQPAPEFIRDWKSCYPLTIVRQPHAGVASARNRGIRDSKGSVLVFVDADCRLRGGCLSAFDSTVRDSPQDNCFQLRLIGDRSHLVGRAEELRLITLQDHMLRPNGCIQYLNTAGFAIRRDRVDAGGETFDSSVRRGEDTLLLAKLMKRGELPRFVPNAVVQHSIQRSLIGCFLKDIRSGYLEGEADKKIASKGVRIRVGYRERLRMLLSMWKTSGEPSIGRAGYFVLLARQTLERIVSVACRQLRPGSHSRAQVDPCR
ncbi:MAG: glycosyltransferase [Terriglobia bacterium]